MSIRNQLRINHFVRSNFLILTFVFILFACNPKEPEWRSIFNGEDLTGWTPKFAGFPLGENYRNTFRVEDGLLKVSYDEWAGFNQEFGHIFYEEEFSNYRMRFEYRFVNEQVPGGPGWAFRNSGIMLHCQPPETMTIDQDFPVSVEGQILGGNGTDDRTTANVCTPGTNVVIDGELVTRHCINSSSSTFHGDQWVTMEVEVIGSESVKQWINDELVFELTLPQLDPRDENAQKLVVDENNLLISRGYVSLQAESHPVHFRNIEVMEL